MLYLEYFEHNGNIYMLKEEKNGDFFSLMYINGAWAPHGNPFEIMNNGSLIPKNRIEPFLKNEGTTSSIVQQLKNIPIFYYGITACIIAASLFLFFSYRTYENITQTAAQQELKKSIHTTSALLTTIVYESGPIISEFQSEWNDAIFSKYNKRDFNQAIAEVKIRNSEKIKRIESMLEDAEKSISITFTTKNEENNGYSRLKNIFLVVAKYAELAIAPSGSLQTYGQQVSSFTVEVKSALRELQLLSK